MGRLLDVTAWTVAAAFACAACSAPSQTPSGTSAGAGGTGGASTSAAGTGGVGGATLLAPDPACDTDGCLRIFTLIGHYGVAALRPFVDPEVMLENGYSVYSMVYWTHGREALGTVTIPYQIAAPPGGWHIVANNHGTTGVADRCAVTGTVWGAGLAGLFGARGLIGVAIDYPGLGGSGVHPYLVSESEGRGVLDGLRATRQLSLHLEAPLSDRYAVVGLSQGGHATLAAAALHSEYAAELDIRAFAVAGPATVWEEHWRIGLGLDGDHLTYHAMLAWSWAQHYGFADANLWASALAPQIDDKMNNVCVFDPSGAPESLLDELPDVAVDIFDAQLLSAWGDGSWTGYQAFGDAFAANRVGPYPQTAPLLVYQGDADVVTPALYTTEVVGALEAGGVTVDYRVVPGGQHIDVAFGFLATPQLRTDESIAWLRQHLNAP